MAAAPQALLTIAALFGGASSGDGGTVSAGSAVALAVGSLVLYGWEGFAAWLFSLRSAGRSFVLWGFRRPTKAYFWVVPLGLVAVYAFSIVHDIIVHPKQQAIVSDFPHSVLGAGMFVLVAVVMAPLFEEIVFRGFLFRGFANSWGWVWGALASAAIFGAAHLQLDVFLPLAALGFVLAWAYKPTGSLWTCITMHALFNLIAVVAWALTQLRRGDAERRRRRGPPPSGSGEQRRLAQLPAVAVVVGRQGRERVQQDAAHEPGVLAEDLREHLVLPLAHHALAVVDDEVDARVAGADVAGQPHLGAEALADHVAERLQEADLGRRLEARPLGHHVGAAREQAALRRVAPRGARRAPRARWRTRRRA